MLRTAPPGNPKIVSTPSCFKLSKRISAPVFFKSLPPCTLGTVFGENGFNPVPAGEFQFLNSFLFHFFLWSQIQAAVPLSEFAFVFIVVFHTLLQFRVTGDVLLD